MKLTMRQRDEECLAAAAWRRRRRRLAGTWRACDTCMAAAIIQSWRPRVLAVSCHHSPNPKLRHPREEFVLGWREWHREIKLHFAHVHFCEPWMDLMDWVSRAKWDEVASGSIVGDGPGELRLQSECRSLASREISRFKVRTSSEQW